MAEGPYKEQKKKKILENKEHSEGKFLILEFLTNESLVRNKEQYCLFSDITMISMFRWAL